MKVTYRCVYDPSHATSKKPEARTLRITSKNAVHIVKRIWRKEMSSTIYFGFSKRNSKLIMFYWYMLRENIKIKKKVATL